MLHRTTIRLPWELYAQAKTAVRWLEDNRKAAAPTLNALVCGALERELARLALAHRQGEPWPEAGSPPPTQASASGSSSGITAALRHRVLKRDGFRCQHCGVSASRAELHVDHITPHSAGGSDHPRNLQTLCGACNLGKGGEQ